MPTPLEFAHPAHTGLGIFSTAAPRRCHAMRGEAPVGLMVCGVAMTDGTASPRRALSRRACSRTLSRRATPGFIDRHCQAPLRARGQQLRARLQVGSGDRRAHAGAARHVSSRRAACSKRSGPVRDARALAKRYRKSDVLRSIFHVQCACGTAAPALFPAASPKPVSPTWPFCRSRARRSGCCGRTWRDWPAEPLAALREFHRVLAIEGC